MTQQVRIPRQAIPEEFREALRNHNVSLAEEQIAPLNAYCNRLWRWNAKVNLTRHTDFDSFVARDLVDTLRLANHLPNGARILDVGSGGGVPGIVLAILRPDLDVSLAESVGKKARVLKDIAKRLKLSVDVHADRAEKILKKRSFDILTIRAVAATRKLLFWFQTCPNSFGKILMIKGPRWEAERDEAMAEGLLDNATLTKIDEYATPGHDNNSVILSVEFQKPQSA